MPLTLVFMMGRALWTPAATGIDAFAHLPGKDMTAAWMWMNASRPPAHPSPRATILRDPLPADAQLDTSWRKEYATW